MMGLIIDSIFLVNIPSFFRAYVVHSIIVAYNRISFIMEGLFHYSQNVMLNCLKGKLSLKRKIHLEKIRLASKSF